MEKYDFECKNIQNFACGALKASNPRINLLNTMKLAPEAPKFFGGRMTEGGGGRGPDDVCMTEGGRGVQNLQNGYYVICERSLIL